ncbi:GNAT family N-acetyltransferase [Joostella atrarenae]|uniref:GNAT family N-acetyltransferase n=1 Tax=Joostella atrarenae TaxID=679257 RepID=A0ABS9J5W9_9FLAO|nr:GNAT family N-acetyltransferase [Joostella atrarenae]MCF8715832.1 GNAT family N-acetyltransferase [Joostella atrarenae]
MYTVREISSAEAHTVRHPVLREGKPFESAIFPDDDYEDTFHVGVTIDGKPVGTVTLIKKVNAIFSADNQYQLRGMAVLQDQQRKGLGVLLVNKAEEIMQERGGRFIWLNAREIAVPFYKQMGYEIYGDSFIVPKVGLHYLMIKAF